MITGIYIRYTTATHFLMEEKLHRNREIIISLENAFTKALL